MTDKKYSILVVDDQENWRDLLVELLKEDFDVISAKDYEDALNKIKNQNPPFYVIVTDMRLEDDEVGNEDGLKLIEYLDRRGDETKTIVVTGYATVDTAKRALSTLNAFDFLEKRPSNGDKFDTVALKKSVLRAAEETLRHDVFVIMPFEEKFNAAYDRIKKIADSVGLQKCLRADDPTASLGTAHVMDQVLHNISHARIVLVDLSAYNPNVYFELGISKALRKKIVLLFQGKDDQIISVLKGNKIIFYENTFDGVAQLETQLSSELGKLKGQINLAHYDVEEKPGSLSITSNNAMGKDTHNSIIKNAMMQMGIPCFYVWDTVSLDNYPKEIEAKILQSSLIIADLAGQDPEAFYLAGFSHGLKKKRIFLLPKDATEPFDIRAISLVGYSKKLQEEREKAIQDLIVMTQSILNESNEKILRGDKMNKSSQRVKVFLNHATEDKPLVRRLYDELKKYPWIDPWLDEDRLLPGQNWGLEIEKAMEESDAVLVCISNTSVKKTGYVQAEIRKAEEQQRLRPPGVIYMIPVLLEPCKNQVPSHLQKLHWVDMSDLGRIVSIIKSLETLRK